MRKNESLIRRHPAVDGIAIWNLRGLWSCDCMDYGYDSSVHGAIEPKTASAFEETAETEFIGGKNQEKTSK